MYLIELLREASAHCESVAAPGGRVATGTFFLCGMFVVAQSPLAHPSKLSAPLPQQHVQGVVAVKGKQRPVVAPALLPIGVG